MTSADYSHRVEAGETAKRMLEDKEFAFFRDWIKKNQDEILQNFACDLYRESTDERIEYDENGKIVAKASSKTTKAEREKEESRSYKTFIQINDFLVGCAEQAEQLKGLRKAKKIVFEEGDPDDDPDVEYVG